MSNLPPNPKQAYGDKKVNLALVPPVSIAYEAMAFMEGARKYGPYNWRDRAVEAMTYIAALQRHVGQWLDGEEIDQESGNPHLAHAKACLGILIDAQTSGNLIDNRPKPGAMTRILAERAVGPLVGPERFAHACPDIDQGADDSHMVYAEEVPPPPALVELLTCEAEMRGWEEMHQCTHPSREVPMQHRDDSHCIPEEVPVPADCTCPLGWPVAGRHWESCPQYRGPVPLPEWNHRNGYGDRDECEPGPGCRHGRPGRRADYEAEAFGFDVV